MNTKQLRQKILDLAIRGKLVPQDPNDEPASVLLERVRTEKERLIKEGKIKRDKKDNAIIRGDDKSHYKQLPTGWIWTFLGDIFNLQAGKFVQATDIVVDAANKFPCYGGNGLRGYVSNFNREGEYPLIGRQGALCGNLNYASGKFYATEHAVVVDCFSDTNPRWAFYFLDKLNLNQYATATAQPGLSVKTINEVLIPLPPIAEQSRIVSAIESSFSVIDEIERNKSNLQSAVVSAKSKVLSLAIRGKLVPQDPNDEPASVLLERIRVEREAIIKAGKIKREKTSATIIRNDDNSYYAWLPDGWAWCQLNDVVDYIQRGKSPKYSPIKKFPVLAQKCNQWKGITLEKALFIDPNTIGTYTSERFLKTGDVVINSTGVGTLGRIGIFDASILGDYSCIVADSHVTVVRSNVNINPKYLYFFFRSDYQQQKIEKSMKGSTNQKELYLDTIKSFELPLPPFAEQCRIVSAIESTFEQLDSIYSILA